MPISIYNYENSKIPLILEMILHTSLGNEKHHYYIDSDWQYGPNTLIVFRNPLDEERIIDELRDWVNHYIINHSPSEEAIVQKKTQYLRSQKTLSEVEMREGIDVDFMYDHGKVIQRPKKHGIYNSEHHRNVFDAYRFELNDLHLKILAEVESMNAKEKAHFFLYMFIHIATLFEDGPSRGYLTFLSHAQGFLSNIEARGLNSNIQHTFEERRRALFADNAICIKEGLDELMVEWKMVWTRIAKEMHKNFDYRNYEGEEGIDLKPQLELLKSRLSKISNPFHDNLLKMGDEELERFILSKKMLVFRDIVNLFYLSLPLFEQSMVKKQFYAYSTVKYYEDYFNGNVLYKIE